MYDTFNSYITPYLTASQIVRNSEEYLNQEVQIIGFIVNDSTSYHDGAMLFNLTDGEATIRVTYTGSPPQNFMEGEEVVTIGTVVSFYSVDASEILVKCPSKYESGRSFLFSEPIF